MIIDVASPYNCINTINHVGDKKPEYEGECCDVSCSPVQGKWDQNKECSQECNDGEFWVLHFSVVIEDEGVKTVELSALSALYPSHNGRFFEHC